MRLTDTHRKRVLIGGGALIAIAAVTQLTLHFGFKFGPYQVRQGDDLYGILVKTFDGSEYHANKVLEFWRATPDPDLLYANRNPALKDGDTVTVRYNTLTITKPNGKQYRNELVNHQSIVNRNVQVVVHNMVVLTLAVTAFALLYLLLEYRKGTKLPKKILISLAAGGVTALLFEFWFYLARVFFGGPA